jgi:hypothetical protein
LFGVETTPPPSFFHSSFHPSCALPSQGTLVVLALYSSSAVVFLLQ